MNIIPRHALLHYISLNRRLKAVLYVLLAALAILVAELVIWSVAKLDNHELRNNVEAKRDRLYKHEQWHKLDQRLRQTLPLVVSFEKKHKSLSSQTDVMKQLSGMARNQHLSIHSLSSAVMSEGDNGSSINSIEMRVSGRYSGIRKMLGQISTMNTWVDVADIKIERSGESHVDAQVRLLLIKEPPK